MPDRNERVKENVPGAYYVDSTCIDCDVCRDTAPENFRRSDANSYSFVYKQPLTEEELAACEEAVLCCPVEAIGNDGEQELRNERSKDFQCMTFLICHLELRSLYGSCQTRS